MKNSDNNILDTTLPDIKKDLAALLSGNKQFETSDYVKVFLKDFLNFYGNVYKTELRTTPENIKAANNNEVPFTVNEKRNRTYINLNRNKILDNIKNDILHALLDEDGEQINYEKLIIEMSEHTNIVNEISTYIDYKEANFAGKGKKISEGKFIIYNVLHEDNDKFFYSEDNRGNIYKNIRKENDNRKTMDELFTRTLIQIKNGKSNFTDIIEHYIQEKTTIEASSVEENYQTFEFIELYKSIEFALKARYTEFKQKDFRDLISETVKTHNPNVKEEEINKISSGILFKSTDAAGELLEDKVFTEEDKQSLVDLTNTLKGLLREKLLSANIEDTDLDEIINAIINFDDKKIFTYKEKYGDIIEEVKIKISSEDYPLINRKIVSIIKKLNTLGYKPSSEDMPKISKMYKIASTVAEIKNNTIKTLRKIGFNNWMEDIEFFNNSSERYGNLGALAHQFYYCTYQNNHEKILKILKSEGYDDNKLITINKILADFIQPDNSFKYDENKVNEILEIIGIENKELTEKITTKIKEMKNIRYDNFLGEVTTVRNQISHENINLTKEDMIKLLEIIESVGPIDKVHKALQKTMYVVKSYMIKGISPAKRYQSNYKK